MFGEGQEGMEWGGCNEGLQWGIIFQFLPFLLSQYPMPLTSLVSNTMQLQSCQWFLDPGP